MTINLVVAIDWDLVFADHIGDPIKDIMMPLLDRLAFPAIAGTNSFGEGF